MAASDLTTTAFIFKKNYSTVQVRDLTTRDHVQYAMTPHEDIFIGASYDYTIRSGNPQGISGTFANAQANASSSKGLQFSGLRKNKFGVITLDGEAIAASRGNKGAFYDLVTMETDNLLIEMGDRLAFDFYRDTSGVRGQRKSASTNVITMQDPDTVRNFKEGMTVGASPNANGSSARVGTTTIAAVDEDSGTITLTSAAAITSFADNDYLFADGDVGTCIEGLEVCTPLTAPVNGDSFRGKDRSTNVRRYAGSRINDTTSPIEENLGLCAVHIAQQGRAHMVDNGFLNPINFWIVARRLNAKVEYESGGDSVDYGFQYIMLHTPAGSTKIYSDPDCPTTRGRLTRSGSQRIVTMDGYPHIIQQDGLASLRSATANSIEARAWASGNLVQDDPVAQGVTAI
jgi:hypothetical protein